MAISGGRGRGGRGRGSPRGPRGRPFTPRAVQREIEYTTRGAEEDQSRRPAPGEIVRPRRALAQDITNLWNVSGPNGEILIPQYETIGGELGELAKREKMTAVSSFPTAVRHQWHKTVGPAAETKKLWKVANDVVNIHNGIIANGFPSDPDTRRGLRHKLIAYARVFGKHPRKDSKKKSRTGLVTTARMIRTGNAPSTIESLRGIYRNIGIRINGLNRMQPKLSRTLESALREADVRKRKYYEWIDQTGKDAEELHRMNAADRQKVMARCESRASTIKSRINPTNKLEGERLVSILMRAASLLRDGRVREATTTLRAARPWQYTSMSREHILSSERIAESRNWDRAAMREVTNRQARLFGENIEFWSQGPEHEWMIPWSYGLMNSMRRLRVAPAKRLKFEHAIQLMEQEKFPQAKEEWARALAV